MKPCVHVSSSPTLQLSRPYAAHKALPCSFPSLSSSRKIAGKDHASLLWLRVRGRCLKPLHLTVFVLNKDGGAKKHEDEWYATDASRVKLLTWGILQRWGSPAAVGAMVGSIVARKTLVFVVSFSFIVLMAVHKGMEAQGAHLDRVSHVLSRQDFTNFLARMKSIFSTVIMYLSCAVMACFSKSCKFIRQLMVPMPSLLAKTSLTWNQRQLREIVKNPALGSEFKSADTLIADINACIQNVEGMIKTEKDIHTDTKWTELKDNLSSLKTRVAFLSKVDRYTVPSTDVLAPPGSDLKVSVKKPKSSASVKSKGSNAQQSKVDKMRATREDKMLVNTSVDMLKQEAMHEIPGELDVMNVVGDVSLTERVASTKRASAAASEAALDLGSGLPFKEINGRAVSDAQPLDVASVKIGESESCSPRPKYIDYWAEQDPIRSASSGDVEEQNNNALSKNLYYEREGSVLRTGQDLEKKIASKVPSPDLGRKSFYSDEYTSSVNNEVGSKNAGSRTDISVKVRDGDGSGRSVDSQRSPRKSGSVNDHNKVAGCNSVKDEAILNGSQNPLLGANVKKDDVVEQGTAILRSTKELAFVRENADLHVLTGFSRSFNDGEFQKLMNDGETALRHGKAGLFGDIEVNEAETMLYKAADHFASAAALDLSSVEAVGLWGNTLLVHGELKLMLSRELRHLISTPDVISPYWIRQNKGMETREKSNRTVLQRTFQTVCEECEELLIQAGRKYRTVLSISNSEVRALYNWGLALCFRAQLITEEGGQDAREAADRIYLAAIDKFEAMMGISQRYAPGAMLNWGLTLKDRSRLWASDSAERISLLQQAKQLFFDALRLQPDDAQIHSAFVTCCVELKELYERQESQSKRSMKTFFGK